jgi:hypothetical protein
MAFQACTDGLECGVFSLTVHRGKLNGCLFCSGGYVANIHDFPCPVCCIRYMAAKYIHRNELGTFVPSIPMLGGYYIRNGPAFHFFCGLIAAG